MLVGCYTLDIYCAYGSLTAGKIGICNTNAEWSRSTPWQYAGITKSECLREARRDGWKINKKNNRAVCPDCILKGRK